MQISIRLSALILSAVLVSAIDNGFAQTNFYEGKTVRMIVGFTAGGGYDTLERLAGTWENTFPATR